MNFNNYHDNRNRGWKKKVLNFLDKRGFYVVLAICLVIIGVTAYVTLSQPGEDLQAQEDPYKPVQYVEGGGLADQSTPLPTYGFTISQSTPMPELAAVTPTASPSPSASPKPKPQLERPVNGEVTVPFADSSLVYNKTLAQWATHRGIDILAAEGTEVKAVSGGTVEKIAEDALLGITVALRHENGNLSIYSNLNKDLKLKEGAKLKKGDVVGIIGQTAIAELDEGAHLHFEYFVADKAVDPLKYLSGLKLTAEHGS